MKIFKRKGKSFTGLFVRTFFVSIIAVILAVVVWGATLYNNFWNFMEDKFYTDRNIGMQGANILPELYKDLDKDYVIKNHGWIEILQNNEVVDTIGEKKDDTTLYNTNLLAHMNDKGEMYALTAYEPITVGYTVKVYDEEPKYTYLVKIPRFDKLLLDYVDEMMVVDENSKEFEEFMYISLEVLILPAVLCILTFLAIMGLNTIISIKSIKKPLVKIQNGIDEFSSGNMDTRIEFYSYKELNEIKYNFNYMIEKMDKAEKEKQKSEESKKNIIRDISHDIKTPITSILGYSKAIIEKENMSEEERDTYLGYIHDKTIRIDYLINELFKFVELDSANYKLNKVKKDYVEFVREVVLLHYKDIEENNMILELDIEEKPIVFEFDDKNIERAISNLIVNAIKYNEKNTTIKISVKQDKDRIITIVEDDGIGMEKELCESLFEEFVRGDKSRRTTGGSGLGLTITKKIIDLHGGNIRVESNLGIGSRFVIELII